jgi:uncharacterized alkaline shock family protein YloU
MAKKYHQEGDKTFMLTIAENELGNVAVSDVFFADVVKNVTLESFGIIRTVGNVKQKVKSLIQQRTNYSGITIDRADKDLFIELHVEIQYGINISETIKNLADKIKYTIQNYNLDICVRNIDVDVDSMSVRH